VRHWYHALAAKYKSTADDAYRLLRAIMNTAVADKRVGRSPCTVKGAGATESAKRPIATSSRAMVRSLLCPPKRQTRAPEGPQSQFWLAIIEARGRQGFAYGRA
jgi:hypothetical protein